MVSLGAYGRKAASRKQAFSRTSISRPDGGRILASVLPNKASYAYQGTERFGMIILIVLIVTGILGKILNPLVYVGVTSIYSAFGF